jgi:hypothetical protein
MDKARGTAAGDRFDPLQCPHHGKSRTLHLGHVTPHELRHLVHGGILWRMDPVGMRHEGMVQMVRPRSSMPGLSGYSSPLAPYAEHTSGSALLDAGAFDHIHPSLSE